MLFCRLFIVSSPNFSAFPLWISAHRHGLSPFSYLIIVIFSSLRGISPWVKVSCFDFLKLPCYRDIRKQSTHGGPSGRDNNRKTIFCWYSVRTLCMLIKILLNLEFMSVNIITYPQCKMYLFVFSLQQKNTQTLNICFTCFKMCICIHTYLKNWFNAVHFV
jgi:hypothetical protein